MAHAEFQRTVRSCETAMGEYEAVASNALVQLQLTMRAQRAIQKCLSAATFVRRWSAWFIRQRL
jgi:hypothetical protein